MLWRFNSKNMKDFYSYVSLPEGIMAIAANAPSENRLSLLDISLGIITASIFSKTEKRKQLDHWWLFLSHPIPMVALWCWFQTATKSQGASPRFFQGSWDPTLSPAQWREDRARDIPTASP